MSDGQSADNAVHRFDHDARHSLPVSSYVSTVESDGVARQEAQIVRSRLTLYDFLRAPWKGAPS